MTQVSENLPTPSNPMGICGIEFIEFATSQPLALGALLTQFGFVATARHRSREVVLFQCFCAHQTLNIVVNAAPTVTGQPAPVVPTLSAIALRVANAAQAHAMACSLGAWDIPSRAKAMELNIPGIHGVGESVIYFVDRFANNTGGVNARMQGAALTVYDVDFIPLPHDASIHQGVMAASSIFGVVQAVQAERSNDWIDFYTHFFGFSVKADERHGGFDGVLPKGVVLTSPCKTFHWQLIEPPQGADDIVWEEGLIRLGLGSPDVLALSAALQTLGVRFVDVGAVKPSHKGALSHTYLGGVTIELVHTQDAPLGTEP
jgi:4-hydroxyphenylpyruvate dioxygenase